jgi:hypothetical protein
MPPHDNVVGTPSGLLEPTNELNLFSPDVSTITNSLLPIIDDVELDQFLMEFDITANNDIDFNITANNDCDFDLDSLINL